MPNILKFPPQDMPWLHGQVGVFAFQGLHPCQLVHADRSFSLSGSLCGLCIDLTPLDDFLLPLGVFFLAEPIAKAVRLEAPLFSSRAAWRGEICVTMPRATSSSAISRPVHWLIGRPIFAGAEHASAAICARCCAVNLGTAPGRGASSKRCNKLPASGSLVWASACDQFAQRSLHRRTVSTVICNSRAIWIFRRPFRRRYNDARSEHELLFASMTPRQLGQHFLLLLTQMNGPRSLWHRFFDLLALFLLFYHGFFKASMY